MDGEPAVLKAIAHELIHARGGPRKFAEATWQEYDAAEPGSELRVRLLELIGYYVRTAATMIPKPPGA